MSTINRSDIYDKNLNFLIGSGASVGLLPTLALNIQNSATGHNHTIETLATAFEDDEDIQCLLFSYYVENVIAPAAKFDYAKIKPSQKIVLANYIRFIKTILALLDRKSQSRRANIFTTNYDGLIAHCAELLLTKGGYDFVLNDGGVGFINRVLQTRAFNRIVRDQGIFDRHEVCIPQINLIQPHGSVYWYKNGDNIKISYDLLEACERIDNVDTWMNAQFEDLLQDGAINEGDIDPNDFLIAQKDRDAFWKSYKALPVVNPTKWKFHETVFEEHYYQALRMLSYELERPNSVLIVFGFSFADEHILSLVKRSLSNPTLKLFICCYSDAAQAGLKKMFIGFDNVEFIRTDGDLNFTAFNDHVFSVASKEASTK